MSIIEILILAIALSMDAFAVAICKGLSQKKLLFKHVLIVGVYFGVFQGVMPLIGYFLGITFADKIEAVDHWIAFGLLAIIGTKMIIEALEKDEHTKEERKLSEQKGGSILLSGEFGYKKMLPLAVATSIDALAVGISFSLLKVDILLATFSIGFITLVLSGLGVYIGFKFGSKYKSRAELVGGIVLILIGLKILLEHLGIISF